MELLVDCCMLGQEGPYSHTGCIHFYAKLAFWVRDLEDARSGETRLEGVKGSLGCIGPMKGSLGGCGSREGGGNRVEFLDKAPLKIGKSQEPLQLLQLFMFVILREKKGYLSTTFPSFEQTRELNYTFIISYNRCKKNSNVP